MERTHRPTERPTAPELDQLIDVSGEMLCVASMSGRLIAVNAAWSTLGYSEDELRGRLAIDLVHPDDRDRTLAAAARLDTPGAEIAGFENRALHRDGSERRLAWNARTDGRRIYAAVRDVTAQLAVADALAERERTVRSVLETTQEGIWRLDTDDRTSFVNDRMAEMLGYTVDEMLGREVYDFLDDEGARRSRLRLADRRRGVAQQYEMKFTRKDGGDGWMIVTGTPLRDPDGTYSGSLAMITDITDRKREEQALKASEERYRSIVETTTEGVWMIDADHRTTYVNARMAEMLGYEVEEMLGRPLQEFLADDHPDPARELLPRNADPREVRLRHKDGSVVWGLRSGSALTDGDGAYSGALAMIADITERKRSEEALARLAAIVDSSPDAIFSTDPDGMITSWNAAAEEIYGYAASEAIGRSGWMLAPPDGQDRTMRLVETLREGRSLVAFTARALKKDGRVVDVESSVSPIETADGRVVGSLAIVRLLTDPPPAA